jgi:molybdopterin-synthase adenylyltransferase
MSALDPSCLTRYARQIGFAGLGAEGQARLRSARAAVVGVGGLGTWSAELLARAGVGMLRLIDADLVERTNLHRQGLYDESDAAAARTKVQAAVERLRRVNGEVRLEGRAERLTAANVARLLGGMDVILDGTDNFAARFLINDYAVQTGTPWVFAGVVGAEGQVLTVRPGLSPCLRCLYDCSPTWNEELAPQALGVLGPAVAAVAAIQAAEAMKLLAGRADQASPFLLKLNLWHNTVQRIDAAKACAAADCVCCKKRQFQFLSQTVY